MTAAVFVLSIALLFVIVVGVAVARFFANQVTASLSDARRTVSEVRALHAAEIERLHTQYAKVIEVQAAGQKAAIEHAMNLVNYGSADKKPAVVSDREPSPEERVARAIDEQTIVRAVESLKRQYAEIGVNLPEKELETEARNLVMGIPWTPAPSLAGLLKD